LVDTSAENRLGSTALLVRSLAAPPHDPPQLLFGQNGQTPGRLVGTITRSSPTAACWIHVRRHC